MNTSALKRPLNATEKFIMVFVFACNGFRYYSCSLLIKHGSVNSYVEEDGPIEWLTEITTVYYFYSLHWFTLSGMQKEKIFGSLLFIYLLGWEVFLYLVKK